jgi:adenine-specific DNA-methyltransferase
LSKEERIRKLTLLLKELFQFDNNDLDFGIYRIINIKRKEISEFIDKELFEIIKEKIKTVEDNTELQNNLESLKKEIENTFGCDIIEAEKKYAETPKVKDYVDKEKEFKISEKESDIEEEIYDNIISFFSRYYDKGDFISKRRYSKDNKYAIPYNGEEVYLYWANNDQYYIKTAENFRNYSFKAGSLKVDFEITSEEVDVEKNNIKDAEKKFFIFYDAEYDQSNKIVNVKFGYRGLTEDEEKTIIELTDKKRLGKDEVNVYNLEKINEKIAIYGLSELQQKHTKMDGSKSDSSELKWHLNKYTTKNTSDYFIHKDLKKFLKQELDFYIKNELLHIDDIDTKENLDINLKRIKVFKEISLKIIEFLAQIEDFQKKLWEKKKFVINTEYCITLDYIDEKYYPEILKNEKQLEGWKKLYSFDMDEQVKKIKETLKGHGKNDGEKRIEVLKQHQTLSLDTKYFDVDFKYKIISEIENLDDKTTGLIINSDNFQALNLLFNKYNNKIKLSYFDPPYNTGGDGFLYKDGFAHSTWLALLSQQISSIKYFLEDSGVLFSSIDDHESSRLKLLGDQILGNESFVADICIVNNLKGRNDKEHIATANERLFIFKNPEFLEQGFGLTDEQKKRFNLKDENGFNYRILGLRKRGGADTRQERPNMFYPIYVNPADKSVSLNKDEEYTIEVLPRKSDSSDGCWRWGKDNAEKNKDLLIGIKKRTGKWDIGQIDYLFKKGQERRSKPKSVWFGTNYSTDRATKELKSILPDTEFKNPKPTDMIKSIIDYSTHPNDIIIDSFAGSGTTGHATLKLNKEENCERKFILIEMENTFYTVLKPRILKVIYSSNWREGKPQDNDGSNKQIIKYQTLEQYEDSLNNIDFKEPSTLAKESKDYKLKYMLEFESKGSNVLLNLDMFDNPFEYKIKVEENNEIIEKNVDLIETFNYIYGIDVKSIQKKKNLTTCYIIVKGQRKEKDIIVIWRDKSDDFNPEEDKKFIETEVLTEDFDEIFTNGTSLVKEAKSVDEIFKTNLFRG